NFICCLSETVFTDTTKFRERSIDIVLCKVVMIKVAAEVSECFFNRYEIFNRVITRSDFFMIFADNRLQRWKNFNLIWITAVVCCLLAKVSIGCLSFFQSAGIRKYCIGIS